MAAETPAEDVAEVSEDAPANDDGEWIDVSEAKDGGIMKKILKEGQGESTPPNGSNVTCHYVGTLTDGGAKFDSSRDRNDYFKFDIGQGRVIKGWDQGIATMKRGEMAILRCKSDYAYGDTGSGDKIPPGASLDFEVEMIDWEEKDKWEDLSYNEKEIKKQVLKSVSGWDKAKFGTSITFSYKARLEEDLESAAFETRENVTLNIEDHTEKLTEALEVVLTNIKEGESLLIKAPHFKAYGVDGNSGLGVPARATVYYEVSCSAITPIMHVGLYVKRKHKDTDGARDHGDDNDFPSGEVKSVDGDKCVVVWTKSDDEKTTKEETVDASALEAKQTWDMSKDEKIGYAVALKNRGNERYKGGSYQSAIKFYEEAHKAIDSDYGMSDEEKSACNEKKVAFKNNLAMTYLKMNNFAKVIETCTEIFDKEKLNAPNNVKANFRLGEAQRLSGATEQARETYQKVLSLDPDNAPAKARLAYCEKVIAKHEAKQAKMYRKAFKQIRTQNVEAEKKRKAAKAARKAEKKAKLEAEKQANADDPAKPKGEGETGGDDKKGGEDKDVEMTPAEPADGAEENVAPGVSDDQA